MRCGLWSLVLCFVFFFKQKTAYEMRISDWSSDVCSSDLREQGQPAGHAEFLRQHGEDEIGLLLGQEVQMALRAVQEPLAEHAAGAQRDLRLEDEIGRASCRERVCQYV